jgi:hypothetical protein
MGRDRSLQDRILYIVVTEGGGQDGRDHTDKGGKVMLATFDLDEAKKRVGSDSRFKIEKRIVNEDDVKKALAKLDPIDLLLVKVAIHREPVNRR